MRCRGVRYYAVLLIAGCANSAPSAQPAPPASATSISIDATVMLPPELDPWNGARLSSYPAPPAPERPATPVLEGPKRAEVPLDPTPGPRVTAISSSIEIISATPDARAAITADFQHAVRLWPTLDGKREPLVVSMRAPALLSITRDGDAFAIAGVDSAGQIELLRATSSGEITRRLELGIARPILSLRATSDGFVALRDDRVALLIALDGTIRAELATEPGQYLASIAVRDDRALAIIESDDRVHGRWIDLSSAMWGEETRDLPILGDDVVLSANHERVAGFQKGRHKVISIIELSTGKVVRTMKDLPDNVRPIGFVSDTHVAVMSEGRAWWGGGGDGTNGAGFDVANGHLIGGAVSAVSLTTPEGGSEYVGYRVGTLTQLRPTKAGYIATDGRSIVELDAHFHTRAGFSLADLPTALTQVTLVDDTHAVGYSYNENRSIYLISTKEPRTKLVATKTTFYTFERSSGLLAYGSDAGMFVSRFDKTDGEFGPAIQIDAKPGELYLLDPAESKRDEIAIIHRSPDFKTFPTTFGTVGEYAFLPTREQTFAPSQHWLNTNGDPRSLVQSTRTRATNQRLTAELLDQRLVLRDGKTVRWTVPNPASDLVWSGDQLVLFGAGVATVDLATGEMRDRKCGAWFGKWDYAPDIFGTSLLCEP